MLLNKEAATGTRLFLAIYKLDHYASVWVILKLYLRYNTLQATVQLKLDRVAIRRLCVMGYLPAGARDPAVIRDAASAALADRLAPSPAALADDERH